jgi:hypothetical protein
MVEGGRRTARGRGGVGGGRESVGQHVGHFRVVLEKGGLGPRGARGQIWHAGQFRVGYVRPAGLPLHAAAAEGGHTPTCSGAPLLAGACHTSRHHIVIAAAQASLSGVRHRSSPVTHQLLPGDAKLLHLPLSHAVIQVGDDGAGHLICCCFPSVAWIGQRAAGAVGAS